jgi:hypothetical protein
MAGEREIALRRAHVRAIPLVNLRVLPRKTQTVSADFRVGNPDARVRTSLSVLFRPDDAFAALDPADSVYSGYLAAGNHGLAILGRESADEQGAKLWIADPVLGTLSAPVPLPGGTFGWLISDDADAREWYCRLVCRAGDSGLLTGTWFARVTCTDRVGMKPEEWERVADRLYLRGGDVVDYSWGGLG